MFGLGFTEILVILGVALLVVGPDKLPELAQKLGRTVWQVRRTAEEFRREIALPSLGLNPEEFKSELSELRDLKRELISPLPPLPETSSKTPPTEPVPAGQTDSVAAVDQAPTDAEKETP